MIASLIASTAATLAATAVASNAAAYPLLTQKETLQSVQRSANGSRLTVVLLRAEEVRCYDSDTQGSAACRVIRGRLCCEAGGWLPPPYNRAVVEERVIYVIDCPTRRFDRRGDGRGWQLLESDAVVAEVAAANCPTAVP
jgi:hypothetical protein